MEQRDKMYQDNTICSLSIIIYIEAEIILCVLMNWLHYI